MLDTLKNNRERSEHHLAGSGETGHTGVRVQLVHRAEAFDAKGVFGRALTANQRGFSRIPAFRIDAVQRKAWFAEGRLAHKNARSRRDCTSFNELWAVSSSDIFSRNDR